MDDDHGDVVSLWRRSVTMAAGVVPAGLQDAPGQHGRPVIGRQPDPVGELSVHDKHPAAIV